MSIQLYPAIDLRGGEVVRLYQGDYDQVTYYPTDPVDLARAYENAGAAWLHIVDLDAARGEQSENLYVIEEIATRTALRLQGGGGVRDEEGLLRRYDAGISRVVIGSLAVKQPALVRGWFERFGTEALCLAADVRADGQDGWLVQISGWEASGGMQLDAFIACYQDVDLRHALCTDVSRDGTLGGPNVALYRGLIERFPWLQVQASGGVSSLDDLRALAAAEIDGVIVGKALLDGRFSFEEALACSRVA